MIHPAFPMLFVFPDPNRNFVQCFEFYFTKSFPALLLNGNQPALGENFYMG